MNKNKYIVPIYCDNEFNGTGFIIGNLLITAAHVVETEKNICFFHFNRKKIEIGPENNLIFEYPKEKSMQGHDNIFLDLAIYQLSGINSPLELRMPSLKDICTYQGYSDSSLLMDLYDNIRLDDKDWYYPLEKEKPIRINNTYLSVMGICKKGNSGGPLFQGEYVVSMLVGNQQYQSFSMDRYIKSEYILHKISCL